MSHCSLIGVYLSWLIYTLHSSLTRPQNVRGSRKRKCSGLDVLLRMIPSAIYTLIYSLLHWRSEFFGRFFCFFFYLFTRDEETSISTQLKPVTVYSVTLRRKVNCIPTPGVRWDKHEKQCCGRRLFPSATHTHSALLFASLLLVVKVVPPLLP